MGYKLAIDFGTTNSVIARWNESTSTPEVLHLPTIGTSEAEVQFSGVPSLLYVHDARAGKFTIGQAVRQNGLDSQRDNRLFRNFKRGIVQSPAPEPRLIDGQPFADADAGKHFLDLMIQALPHTLDTLDELVLTAPVSSFENYIEWLSSVVNTDGSADTIRVIDESTAAALGYAVTEPKALVLVFDFGGGTLDVSLVELPERRENVGGFLRRLLRGGASKQTARVIGKSGRVIGGSDVDQWMVADVLEQCRLTTHELGAGYSPLLTACETAKIALSTETNASIRFEASGKSYTVDYTRDMLEALLEKQGFYQALRRVVDKVMYVARQRGVFKEDIKYVLLVGGTSLMPSVQRTLKGYFTETAVRADKPFTAVAEGALLMAAGYGLDDYLIHSYGLRHLDPETNTHAYDEIIPMGSRYPSEKPIEVLLGASHAGQDWVEFVVGEIDSDAISMIEVRYEDGQAVFVAQGAHDTRQIIPLNADAAALAKLIPPGRPEEERLRAEFTVDDRRQLRLSVFDLKTNQNLLQDIVVASLR